VWFAERPIRNYRDAARYADHELFRRWWEGMLENDVLFHPGAFENLFVSFAHSEDDIERTLEAADTVMRGLSKHV
jgi:glutamate-1-semialdehyde 2,1-aminomutase